MIKIGKNNIMEELGTEIKMNRVLDFKKNSIEMLSLDELKMTYPEKSIEGIPSYNGIFHFELIDQISNIIQKNGLDYNVKQSLQLIIQGKVQMVLL